jgi:hypothetical protein
VRKYLAFLTIIVAVTMNRPGHAGEQDVRTCEFEIKARCASGDARVTLADGKVTRVEVDVMWCALHGAPTFMCSIDTSRGGQDSEWSENADATVIANRSPWNPNEPDRLEVTVGRDIAIDFSQTQSLGRCGAGAELPRSIVIPAQSKVCHVQLGAH